MTVFIITDAQLAGRGRGRGQSLLDIFRAGRSRRSDVSGENVYK